MRWEVRMMRSKTSLVNKTLYVQGIKTLLPMMVGALLVYFGMEFIPGLMSLMNDSRLEAQGIRPTDPAIDGVAIDISNVLSNPILIAALSILLTVSLFWYQYSRRSSYMLHAMPVKRTTHFFSRVLAGLTMLVGLAFVCYGSLAFLVGFSGNSSLFLELIGLRFIETMVEFLFFFSLSLFVTVVCGNAVLALATYGVVNLLWLFINMGASFLQYLLYRHPIVYSYGGNLQFLLFEKLNPLFPVYFFMRCHESLNVEGGAGSIGNVGSAMHCLFMLIPAAVLFLLALVLNKKKKLEKTGDMVAFDWCKVVFRVLFTVCGGGVAVGGVFVMMVNVMVPDYNNLTFMTVFVLVIFILGAAIGFLVSEMLLRKSVHIFHGKKIPVLQGLIPLLLVVLYVVLMATHVLGPKLMPDPASVSKIRIVGNYSDEDYEFLRDREPEAVKAIVSAHQKLINDSDLLAAEEHVRNGQAHEYSALRVEIFSDDMGWTNIHYFIENEEEKEKLYNTFRPYVNRETKVS